MPRAKRVTEGNQIYHCINRANARLQIFFDEEDYQMFEKVLSDAIDIYETRVLAYCIMPNHYHLVIYPEKDKEISEFMRWINMTHTRRWHQKNNTSGSGHLYQGRYKSFLVSPDHHLLTVLRYVERNPLRANLVKKPLNWKYSSLYRRFKGPKYKAKLLSTWPIAEPKNYLEDLTTPLTSKEIEAMRYSSKKEKPYGNENYVQRMIKKFGIENTTREAGRPSN